MRFGCFNFYKALIPSLNTKDLSNILNTPYSLVSECLPKYT